MVVCVKNMWQGWSYWGIIYRRGVQTICTLWRVAGTIITQFLAQLFNRHCYNCLTVTGTNVQQSLARLISSHWHYFSTVPDAFVQQSLAGFFDSYFRNSSTVTGIIVQQSLTRFFNSQDNLFFSALAWFFNTGIHSWRILSCTRNTTCDLLICLLHYSVIPRKWI